MYQLTSNSQYKYQDVAYTNISWLNPFMCQAFFWLAVMNSEKWKRIWNHESHTIKKKSTYLWWPGTTLQWCHNGRDSVSNHQPHHCLLNRLFGCRSKKTSKLRVTGLCAGNSPGTGEFPTQVASTAENVSIWWRHHHLLQVQPHVQWRSTKSGPVFVLIILKNWKNNETEKIGLATPLLLHA